MSPKQKLQAALSVAVILATVGVTKVAAQSQIDNSQPGSLSRLTSDPRKVEAPKASPSTEENNPSVKTLDVAREGSNSTPASATSGAPSTVTPQTATPDEWQFQVTPYFWLAGLHGTAGTSNRTVQVDESFGDVFHALNFALMGTFEARKGKFVSLTDLEYVNVSEDKATPGPLFSSVDAQFKVFIFDQEVGYRVVDNRDNGAFVDVIGGARIWHLSTDFDFAAGILPANEVQASRNWVDAVGGLRGRAALSEKLFLTGKFDLGGGGSKFTYQVFGGGGYNINPKVALIFGYRVLHVNYDKNNFIYDVTQRGPIVGIGFKF